MMTWLWVGGVRQARSRVTASTAVASTAGLLSVTRSRSTGLAGEVLVPLVQEPVEVVFDREVQE
jgi:hypothetical protein